MNYSSLPRPPPPWHRHFPFSGRIVEIVSSTVFSPSMRTQCTPLCWRFFSLLLLPVERMASAHPVSVFTSPGSASNDRPDVDSSASLLCFSTLSFTLRVPYLDVHFLGQLHRRSPSHESSFSLQPPSPLTDKVTSSPRGKWGNRFLQRR